MTVAELITELEKFPKDLPVFIEDVDLVKEQVDSVVKVIVTRVSTGEKLECPLLSFL